VSISLTFVLPWHSTFIIILQSLIWRYVTLHLIQQNQVAYGIHIYADFNEVNKIGKVYSLEYTEIPKVFFTPQYGWWRQQVASLTTTARIKCGLSSPLFKRITKATMVSNATDVIMWSEVPTVITTCPNNDFNYHYCNNVFHCCSSAYQNSRPNKEVKVVPVLKHQATEENGVHLLETEPWLCKL
jgi:hypothetical protein